MSSKEKYFKAFNDTEEYLRQLDLEFREEKAAIKAEYDENRKSAAKKKNMLRGRANRQTFHIGGFPDDREVPRRGSKRSGQKPPAAVPTSSFPELNTNFRSPSRRGAGTVATRPAGEINTAEPARGSIKNVVKSMQNSSRMDFLEQVNTRTEIATSRLHKRLSMLERMVQEQQQVLLRHESHQAQMSSKMGKKNRPASTPGVQKLITERFGSIEQELRSEQARRTYMFQNISSEVAATVKGMQQTILAASDAQRQTDLKLQALVSSIAKVDSSRESMDKRMESRDKHWQDQLEELRSEMVDKIKMVAKTLKNVLAENDSLREQCASQRRKISRLEGKLGTIQGNVSRSSKKPHTLTKDEQDREIRRIQRRHEHRQRHSGMGEQQREQQRYDENRRHRREEGGERAGLNGPVRQVQQQYHNPSRGKQFFVEPLKPKHPDRLTRDLKPSHDDGNSAFKSKPYVADRDNEILAPTYSRKHPEENKTDNEDEDDYVEDSYLQDDAQLDHKDKPSEEDSSSKLLRGEGKKENQRDDELTEETDSNRVEFKMDNVAASEGKDQVDDAHGINKTAVAVADDILESEEKEKVKNDEVSEGKETENINKSEEESKELIEEKAIAAEAATASEEAAEEAAASKGDKQVDDVDGTNKTYVAAADDHVESEEKEEVKNDEVFAGAEGEEKEKADESKEKSKEVNEPADKKGGGPLGNTELIDNGEEGAEEEDLMIEFGDELLDEDANVGDDEGEEHQAKQSAEAKQIAKEEEGQTVEEAERKKKAEESKSSIIAEEAIEVNKDSAVEEEKNAENSVRDEEEKKQAPDEAEAEAEKETVEKQKEDEAKRTDVEEEEAWRNVQMEAEDEKKAQVMNAANKQDADTSEALKNEASANKHEEKTITVAASEGNEQVDDVEGTNRTAVAAADDDLDSEEKVEVKNDEVSAGTEGQETDKCAEESKELTEEKAVISEAAAAASEGDEQVDDTDGTNKTAVTAADDDLESEEKVEIKNDEVSAGSEGKEKENTDKSEEESKELTEEKAITAEASDEKEEVKNDEVSAGSEGKEKENTDKSEEESKELTEEKAITAEASDEEEEVKNDEVSAGSEGKEKENIDESKEKSKEVNEPADEKEGGPLGNTELIDDVMEGATSIKIADRSGFEVNQVVAINEGEGNFELVDIKAIKASEGKAAELELKSGVTRVHEKGEAAAVCLTTNKLVDNAILLNLENDDLETEQVGIQGVVMSTACGVGHVGAISTSGSLYMWGSNQDHQLGIDLEDGAQATQIPTHVSIPECVVHVSCGFTHTICICRSGAMYSWGSGMMGKLGLGHDRDIQKPEKVPMNKIVLPDQIKSLGHLRFLSSSCGQYASAAIGLLGERTILFTWGTNRAGQLGTGTTKPEFLPTYIPLENEESAGVVDVSMGNTHTGCVTKDGKIAMWGENDFGQLGYDCEENQLSPRFLEYKFLKDVVQVSCGERHTSCLLASGDVYSWGSGETHQMGIFDNEDQPVPVKAKGIKGNVNRISVGRQVTAAFTEEGDVYMWGYTLERPTPAMEEALQDSFVLTGDVGSDDCVVFITGISQDVQCLDINEDEDDEGDKKAGGEEGNTDQIVAKKFDLLRGVRIEQFSCGAQYTLALARSGQVYAWGDNGSFQLGNGNDEYVEEPEKIEIPLRPECKKGIVRVVAGHDHSMALAADGSVYTWGSGQMGRLGHGNDVDCHTPKCVEFFTEGKIKIMSICASEFNSGAVSIDGKIFGWGAGANGQLSNDGDPSLKPIVISLPEYGIKQLEFGQRHAACVTKGGIAYTWGDNQFGQLGRYTMEKSDKPAFVKDFVKNETIISSLACTGMNTFFLTKGGEVFGCGTCDSQMLGPDVEEDQTVPKKILFTDSKDSESKAIEIVELDVGREDCCARSKTGSIFVWGYSFEEIPKVVSTEKPMQIMSIGGQTLMVGT